MAFAAMAAIGLLAAYAAKNTPSPSASSLHSSVEQPRMIAIQGGAFEMGDVLEDNEYNQEPVHPVAVGDFLLAAFEVTFEEYDAFCKATDRIRPDDKGWGRGRWPVIHVSWNDAIVFCNWLSTQHGYLPVYTIRDKNITANWSANGYRLPTETEWEYAARQGGQILRFGNGSNMADPAAMNFNATAMFKKGYSISGKFREKTVRTGSFPPNALGLYDMSGNVWEWCWDWYGDYPSIAETHPKGPDSGSGRVLRGGSWNNFSQDCRVANRSFGHTQARTYDRGFRLARTP